MSHKSRAARQAAAARHASAVRPDGRPRRRWPVSWWVAGAVVVVVAAGAAWWITSGHPRANAQAPAAPLLGQQLPDEGYDHVSVGTPIQYRAHPPASGPHYPYPAPTGVYAAGLLPGFWVHSLEHGYVVLVYKPPVPPELAAQFDAMVKEVPKSKFGNVKLVIAPYDDMIHPFAVLSWDWRLWLDTFDRGTVLEFYKQHVDHGREDLP